MKSILPRAIIFSLIFLCIALQISTAQVNYTTLFSELPGGDVLRPEGGKSPWFIGIDGGITYSSFNGGPLILIGFTNPYNTLPSAQRFITLDKGNGLGFLFGAAVDVPLSKNIGIIGKLSYNTRSGKFTANQQFPLVTLLPPDTTLITISQDLSWQFRYISFDILLRVQLMDKSLYLLVGPSFNSLSSNSAKLDERIVSPNAFYTQTNGSLTSFTSLSAEQEIKGLKSMRIELKAGLGWWVQINEKLFLTPEVLIGFPISKIADNVYDLRTGTNTATTDFNFWTLFATIGLRWQM